MSSVTVACTVRSPSARLDISSRSRRIASWLRRLRSRLEARDAAHPGLRGPAPDCAGEAQDCDRDCEQRRRRAGQAGGLGSGLRLERLRQPVGGGAEIGCGALRRRELARPLERALELFLVGGKRALHLAEPRRCLALDRRHAGRLVESGETCEELREQRRVSVMRCETSAGFTAASSCSRSSLVRWATVSKRGSTRMAGMPPGADTALPVAASTRPRIARDSPAALRSSSATVRAASNCCEPSSSAFQPGSPPSRCALSDESAANGERPASISASTRSSVVREAARRSKAAASPRAAAAAWAGIAPAER